MNDGTVIISASEYAYLTRKEQRFDMLVQALLNTTELRYNSKTELSLYSYDAEKALKAVAPDEYNARVAYLVEREAEDATNINPL